MKDVHQDRRRSSHPNFRFSRPGDFTDNEPVWRRHLSHLRGRPVRGLEIGCFEGESTVWILEELLTHEAARLVCVDPWPDAAVEARFDLNVRQTARHARIAKRKGRSQDLLPTITGPFDFAYIDGSHEACDVMTDAVHAWRLLAPSGIIVFDDYQWRSNTVRLPPCVAIDAFLSMWGPGLELLHRGWQILVRKVAPPGPAGPGSA